MYRFHQAFCAVLSFIGVQRLVVFNGVHVGVGGDTEGGAGGVRPLGGTHGVFVGVHGERQLFEGLSDLSGRGLPVDFQQTVVVLAFRPNRRRQDEEEEQTAEDTPPPHHQSSQCNHSRQQSASSWNAGAYNSFINATRFTS